MFVKGYGFLSFAKNIGKNISKDKSSNLSGKYSQKLLDHVKHSATDALKTTSKRVIKKKKLKELVILLVMKLLIELRKPQEVHRRII